jgi:hypothetical protein
MLAHVLLAATIAAQLADHGALAVAVGRVVDASTGKPIAGAVIWAAGSAASATPGASSAVRVLTSASGAFVFRGLARGSLVLTAQKAGYVNAAPGQRRPGGTVQPIPVARGARLDGIEIRMWKCASIAGTVVDENGDPAVNTRVEVVGRTFAGGRAWFVPGAHALTDDRGMYRIAELMPGDYAVRVPSTQTAVPAELMDAFFGGTPIADVKRMELSREMNAIGTAIAPPGSAFARRAGGQTFSLPAGSLTPTATPGGIVIYPTVYYPVAPSLSQAAVFTLGSGDERNSLDIALHPVRGVSVSGTLLGPDGPIPATAMRLVPIEDEGLGEPLDVARTMSDWAGGFSFAAVPPGQYELRVLRLPQPPPDVDGTPHISVSRAGTMTIAANPSAGPPPKPPVPADATLVAQLPLAIADANVDNLVVSMTPGARVMGRIAFNGTTDPPPSDAFAGMRIALGSIDGSSAFAPAIATEAGHADESGEFRTYGFPPGRYVMQISPIPKGWFLEGAFYQGRDVTDAPLELTTKDATGVIITFTDRPSALIGTVTGAQGADTSAIVIAYPTDESMWTGTGRRLRTARVAPDGSYTIQALPPGEYYVAAVDEDLVAQWQDPELLRALTRVARTTHVGEGERKEVDLRAAAIK